MPQHAFIIRLHWFRKNDAVSPLRLMLVATLALMEIVTLLESDLGSEQSGRLLSGLTVFSLYNWKRDLSAKWEGKN